MLFSILILLVLVAVGLFVAYLLFMGVFYLVAFVVTAWQLRTGRITREQLAENAAQHKRQKLQQRHQKMKEKERKRFFASLHDLIFPSAIDVALGRSARPERVNVEINIEDEKT